uniref:SXP/RAL-2 family protein Ani s 5-like cation-binding domain-containing protein n=1 Tax=Parascaris univalens TaxID=6257 RepID=A0A915BNY5_PARUN
MNRVFVHLLYATLVVPVFPQWMVYYDDYLPNFLVGANEEQTEQFKRIISDRSLSATEYNQRMDALISQLDPSNREKYMQPQRQAKESMERVSAKFLELISHLSGETKRAAQQLVDNVLASGQQTAQEMNRRMDAILSNLTPSAISELMNAYYDAIQLVSGNDK